MNDIESEAMSIKLVMIGNASVGKTSLVTSWIDKRHDDNVKNTIGCINQTKYVFVQNEKVKVVIWDTAGQEKFSSLIPSYIKGADVIVLTTAINDKNSFVQIGTWLDMIRENIPSEVPIVVAINKIDLNGEYTDSIQNLEEKIRNEHGLDVIYNVSALTGDFVDNMFQNACFRGYKYSTNPKKMTPEKISLEDATNTEADTKKSCC